MTPLRVTAYGKPTTQGSMKSYGRGPLVHSNDARLRPWRLTIAYACAEACAEAGWRRNDGPLVVSATFYVDRPASHYGSGKNAGVVKASAPNYPHTRSSGDLDKLVRALLDAVTECGSVWVDDSQVSSLIASKTYVEGDGRPGVSLMVAVAGEQHCTTCDDAGMVCDPCGGWPHAHCRERTCPDCPAGRSS